MTQSLPSSEIVLYVWPNQWGLPSFDPTCLAAIMFLQVAIPGKFTVSECNNPDLSPNGQLPFLVHEQHSVQSFPSIVKYISGLKASDKANYPNADLDGHLSPSERSQSIAWRAHIESHMGDLVYHMLYSVQTNWEKMTRPMLVSMFPVPQKYYVPGRIRESYRPRLEASGMWTLEVLEKEKASAFRLSSKEKVVDETKNKFLQAFDKEKVLQKSRATFEIYSRLLGENKYLCQNRLSTLDILMTVHILLILEPSYPDKRIQTLLVDEFSTVAHYARRVHHRIFHETSKPIPVTTQHSSFWEIVPRWKNKSPVGIASDPEDSHYTRMRWLFIGVSVGCLVSYLTIVARGLSLRIVRVKQKQEQQQEEEDEEEEDEDEDEDEEVEI